MKDGSVNPDGRIGETSLTLLARVKQQDQRAWERFVSLYSPLVFYWSAKSGLQSTDAEEVCQEVFVAVARAIGGFHRDRPGDTLRGWLRQITKNKVRDHFNAAADVGAGGSTAHGWLQNVEALADTDEKADAATLDEEAAIVYRRAVELIEAEFEPKTCRAFWLAIDGRPVADVAAELKMSRGAVYIAKSRILKRLREEFQDLL